MPSGSSHPAARVRQFFGAIAQRYDLTNRILSGGLDVFWRKKAARLVRRWNPVRILDLATGSGDLARELARACPGVLVVGADFSQPMLARARAKGVAHLVAGDGLRLPFAAATFDAVTVAFGLRNMESWPDALGEMARVLRPGGRALIMDFSMPPAPLLWLYRPYLRHILPKLAALVTRQRAVYEYFADSIERFPSGEEMRALMRQAGLRCEDQIRVQAGIVTMHVAARADRFDPDARPALAPSVRLRDDPVSGEPVLLYPEGFLQLNATSHDILTRCDGVRTMREIVALLAAEYDAAPAEVEGDVAECLRELQARNFIVLSR